MPKKKSAIEREIDLETLVDFPDGLSPECGIKALKDWLAILRRREKQIREADHFQNETEREDCLIAIAQDIRKARHRLKEYRIQLEGRN